METARTRTGGVPWMIIVAVAVTIMRVYSGYRWYTELNWKWPWHGAGGFGCPQGRFSVPLGPGQGGLCDWMLREATYPFIGLYGDFVRNIVIPNFDLFAWFTIFTESFIALTLVLGFLVRISGTIGFLFCLNLIIGVAAIPQEDLTYFIPYLFPPLIVAILGPKWQYGVDSLLLPFYRRLANAPGWRGKLAGLALGVKP
jgi:uncharacterized membrane protein YphA (DoxX/SURF4 family)